MIQPELFASACCLDSEAESPKFDGSTFEPKDGPRLNKQLKAVYGFVQYRLKD